MPKTHFENPFKANLTLERYPPTQDETLQAWDSADELLLQHAATLDFKNKRILILNDAFGALACALEGFDVTSYTDSHLSAEGLAANSRGRLHAISNLDELRGIYDWILIKIPKNLSFLEDLLCRISPHVNFKSQLIAACRLKHLPKASFNLIEKYFGKTSTSLAQKKSRLIFAGFEKSQAMSPYPVSVKMESFAKAFTHHSNLFSREKLDIGTRFFLEHIPQGGYSKILDLGCANGIVGIAAKRENPKAEIYFSDESAMAIESAKINYAELCEGQAQFFWTHCFENQAEAFLDLVLCNPPFHQEAALDESIAGQMFRDAHRALKKGGLLRVVGNSHLMYGQKLKKVFGQSRVVATHPKFVIIDAMK